MYAFYLPSDYLTLTYSDDGLPVLTNSDPTDPSTAENQTRARLEVRTAASDAPQPDTTTPYFFGAGTIQLPRSLFEQFPTYYSDTIDEEIAVSSKAKMVLEDYRTRIDGNNLGLSWWNQIAVDLDGENTKHLKADLANASGSKVLGWVKRNANFGQDLSLVPEALEGSATIDLSKYYAPYYAGGDSRAIFEAKDTSSQKTYRLELDIADFRFTYQTNNVFEMGKELISATPLIRLNDGSKLTVTDSQSQTQTVGLNSNAFVDANALVDQDAFSLFWNDLLFYQPVRDIHHELTSLQNKSEFEKLNLWENYVGGIQENIKGKITNNRDLLADFIVENIDWNLRDAYRNTTAVNTSSSLLTSTFSDKEKLRE